MKLVEPGNSNPVLPAGAYIVKIISFEFTKASTGTEQVLWKAEITDPEAHKGRVLATYTALTQAAIWKVSNLIGSCGIKFDPNSIDTESKEFKNLCSMAVGRLSVWLNAEGQDNKGVPRNNIIKFEQVLEAVQEEVEFSVIDDSPWEE